MRACLVVALVVASSVASGCASAATFFGNRIRDLGEVVRVEAGVSPVLGVSVRAAGIVDVGLGGGQIDPSLGLGWEYGFGYALGATTEQLGSPPRGRELGFPIQPLLSQAPFDGAITLLGHFNETLGPHGGGGHAARHACFFVLPAIELASHDMWLRVHAFDVEASVFLGAYVRVGFSPGEFVDFLLGWFGLDIAGDDTTWRSGDMGVEKRDS